MTVILERLSGAFLLNCELFALTLLFALPLGLVVAFGSMSKWAPFRALAYRQQEARGFARWLSQLRPLSALTNVIVWVIRGTPLILQLIIIFYGPGTWFGTNPWNAFRDGRMTACCIAFIINYACYFSVIYRGGIEGVPAGQREAGEVLGLTKRQIFFKITLLQKRREALEAEQRKNDLVVYLAHDIKTPLTAIVSYVDLLKQEPMPNEKAKEYLDVLDRQSARLKKLTEDLVEASKATTGNLTVDLQPTDVNVFLGQTTGEYEERLAAKQLALCLTPAEGTPRISADGRLLWRVFENLFSNIQKYAQPGTRVYLTCQATDKQVTITFRNISAEPLNISADELMERFVRGDDSRNTEGSGLGLNIAKTLMELQKGQLQLLVDGDLFKAAVIFPVLPSPAPAPEPLDTPPSLEPST